MLKKLVLIAPLVAVLSTPAQASTLGDFAGKAAGAAKKVVLLPVKVAKAAAGAALSATGAAVAAAGSVAGATVTAAGEVAGAAVDATVSAGKAAVSAVESVVDAVD